MPKFIGTLQVEAVGVDEWVLLSPLRYVTYVTKRNIEITVPQGFRNDLASIPRLFQAIVPKVAKHRRAAVVHDYLYRERGNLPYAYFTRAQSDKIFLEAMKTDGVRFTRRWAMYLAVRSGGWVYWRKPK